MSNRTMRATMIVTGVLLAMPAFAAPNPTLEPTYAIRYVTEGATTPLSIRVAQTRPYLGDEVVILGKAYIVTRTRINTDSPGYEGSPAAAARVPLEATVERVD